MKSPYKELSGNLKTLYRIIGRTQTTERKHSAPRMTPPCTRFPTDATKRHSELKRFLGHDYSIIRAGKTVSIRLVSARHRSAVGFGRHLASVRRIAQVVETTSRAIWKASRAYPRRADPKGGVIYKASPTKTRSLEEWFWRLVFVAVACDFLYLGWLVVRLLHPR